MFESLKDLDKSFKRRSNAYIEAKCGCHIIRNSSDVNANWMVSKVCQEHRNKRTIGKFGRSKGHPLKKYSEVFGDVVDESSVSNTENLGDM